VTARVRRAFQVLQGSVETLETLSGRGGMKNVYMILQQIYLGNSVPNFIRITPSFKEDIVYVEAID